MHAQFSLGRDRVSPDRRVRRLLDLMDAIALLPIALSNASGEAIN
jgi:hypothetical protein